MLEIINPKIFDRNKVNSGVTLRNFNLYSPLGFTISNGENTSDQQVEANRRLLSSTIGIKRSQMSFQKQVHGDSIQIIDSINNSISESDGMITSQKGLFLSISIADCAAILIYDPHNEIICGLHSGWRGTMLNIAQKAINILNKEFDSNPCDLQVYISPCAGSRSYEVDYDVAKYFPKSVTQISSSKYLFDNKSEIERQLICEGVNKNNIEISEICTISDVSYHSYRRDKQNSGRMAAFIGMLV